LRSAANWLLTIAAAVVVVLAFEAEMAKPFRIPTASMEPTLHCARPTSGCDARFSDRVIACIVCYRISAPHRGQIVVFHAPARACGTGGVFVKRLVGMPGDTLYMRGGLLYVNGLPQRQGFAATTNAVDPSEANSTSDLFVWQHRIELKNSRFGAPPEVATHDNWGPLVIPRGNYFMMGDNRYCSKDSRYWGLVPHDTVRGKPLIVYYSYRPGPSDGDSPTCNPDTSDRPLPAITDIRWGRIGHRVR